MKLFNEFMHFYNDFVSWSKTVDHLDDWEMDYPNWMDIINVLDQLLKSVKYDELNEEIMEVLLYLIGRDNEREYLAEIIFEHPDILIQLAKRGVRYPDHNTRWQLAYYVGKLFLTRPEVEDIVLSYWYDTNEYVRRRALLALGTMNSNYAEGLAVEAYSTNIEYQKIAALEVLHMINSRKLNDYLKLSEQSDSNIVKNGAQRIKTQRGINHRSR